MLIKFCGGCNPIYNRDKIYNLLSIINSTKKISSDKIVILNGCQRGCHNFYDSNYLVVNVQEYLLNSDLEDWTEFKIINWILKKLNVEKNQYKL